MAARPGMVRRENVLGVGVSAIDLDRALALIDGWIARRERHYVCVTGVHGVMECVRNPALRRIHNQAGLVTPDGMPLAWLLRLGGHRETDRVCGPELMPSVFTAGEAGGYRHFLYGSDDATLQRLQAALMAHAPRAVIVGAFSPPFRPLTPAEDAATVALINAAAPDIVWVGLSTPKQEYWMSEHRDRLSAPVLIGVGAAFDMHAGTRRRAPRFLRRTGFEWTYRLAQEPRRLARRYLQNNPAFVALVLLQKLGLLRPVLDQVPHSGMHTDPGTTA
jgi:N-acetylglucosaminyldiphosphoundecaprenol N-acetyl-beta-D-mannosaminyltransferase